MQVVSSATSLNTKEYLGGRYSTYYNLQKKVEAFIHVAIHSLKFIFRIYFDSSGCGMLKYADNRTNRAGCTLYKKILELLHEESIYGESSIRGSL